MTNKIEQYFNEHEEQRLYSKVRDMTTSQRERYLERVANRYLAEFGERQTLDRTNEMVKCPFCKVFSTERVNLNQEEKGE